MPARMATTKARAQRTFISAEDAHKLVNNNCGLEPTCPPVPLNPSRIGAASGRPVPRFGLGSLLARRITPLTVAASHPHWSLMSVLCALAQPASKLLCSRVGQASSHL